MVHLPCHLAGPSLRNIPWPSSFLKSSSTPTSWPTQASWVQKSPLPGVGGGNDIDSRQGFRFRGLGRGRGWAAEIGLQLGNPQILLPKLLSRCAQGREAVTWLTWSQEAGKGGREPQHVEHPKGS